MDERLHAGGFGQSRDSTRYLGVNLVEVIVNSAQLSVRPPGGNDMLRLVVLPDKVDDHVTVLNGCSDRSLISRTEGHEAQLCVDVYRAG